MFTFMALIRSLIASKKAESFAEWSSLPEHLWLTIFSKCSPIDLLAIKDVCGDWRRIASDFTLTSHLDLRSEDNPKIALDSLRDLFIFASKVLTSIKIDGKIDIKLESDPPLDFSLAICCRRLRRLSLNNFDSLYLTYEALPTDLTHLSLANCDGFTFLQMFDGDHPQDYTSSKFSSVVYLNLSQVSIFDSIRCQSLNMFRGLKYLYLEQLFRVNDGGITQIHKQIISQLVVIDLEGTDIKDESFEYILNNDHSLEDLYLSRTQINGSFDLSKSVAKTLKVLCILNTSISCLNLGHILRTHPSLKSVNCDQNIKQMIASDILVTNQSTADTCLHYLTDNRFDKSN